MRNETSIWHCGTRRVASWRGSPLAFLTCEVPNEVATRSSQCLHLIFVSHKAPSFHAKCDQSRRGPLPTSHSTKWNNEK